MLHKTMQNAAMVYIIIGISGIAGVIERDTGLVQSVVLLLVGCMVMYLTCKTEKHKK